MSKDVVRIAVMGVTGSGKSTLIRTVTGCEDIVIGKTMKSETTNAKAYEVTLDTTTYSLIDTPGFNDSNKRTDKEILDHITQYFSAQFKAGELLSGIIYLHPISRPRFQGTDTLQASVFKELCGSETLNNVVLATTHWKDVDLSTAKTREEELFAENDLLGDIIDDGARTWRITAHNNPESCRKLIKSFANNKATALKVQKQIYSGVESSAAALLTKQLRELELAHQQEIEEQERIAAAAKARRQRQMREDYERHRAEVERLERRAAEDRSQRERIQRLEAADREAAAATAREVARQFELDARNCRLAKEQAEAAALWKAMCEARERQAAEERQRQQEAQEAAIRQQQNEERTLQYKIRRTRAGLRAKSEAIKSSRGTCVTSLRSTLAGKAEKCGTPSGAGIVKTLFVGIAFGREGLLVMPETVATMKPASVIREREKSLKTIEVLVGGISELV